MLQVPRHNASARSSFSSRNSYSSRRSRSRSRDSHHAPKQSSWLDLLSNAKQAGPGSHYSASVGLSEDDNSDSDEDIISMRSDEIEHAIAHEIEHGLTRRNTESKSYSVEEENTVVKKLDRNLVGFLGLLYLLSFLDRSNIGNARVAGMERALGITSEQFDLSLIAFYITYITFEWMIMLYRLVPPHIYISLCVFCWGVVASLQASVTSFPQLLVLRSLLGITEAAFGPGVPFYMTFFYRREELAYRVGLQISAAPLATAFASAIAWVILKLNSYTGLEGWRALFLFEGAPSILVAWLAWYWIPDSPNTARWLTGRERKVACLRLQQEAQSSSHSSDIKESKSAYTQSKTTPFLKDLVNTLLDPKSWLTSLMFLSVNVSFASLPVFLPTIINSMAFSPLTSQILAAPPYLFAFVFVLLMGRYSDRTSNSRGTCLCAAAGLSCISYSIIAFAGLLHNSLGEQLSIGLRYMAVYPAAMGLFASVVLIITWTLNNQQSTTGKGVGMVILNVVGQCGPLIGVQLFPEHQGPLYVKGMTICAAFMGGVVVLSLGLRWWLSRLNAKIEDDEIFEMIDAAQEDLDGERGRYMHDLDVEPLNLQDKPPHVEQYRFML